MSILASDVFARIRAELDDDNSGRYTESQDLVPAVNSAVQYLVQVLNIAFEQKKYSPENLRELVRVDALPTAAAGTTGSTRKANITAGNLNIWTILGVEPDPHIYSSSPFTAGPGEELTTLAPDAFIGTRNKLADRLTIEQWNETLEDPFSAGSMQSIPSVFIRPAYIGPGRYFNDTEDYILIRPSTAFISTNVGIWYLKNPTAITDGTDSVEFPQSMFNLIVDKSLNYISRQHGPESKLGAITEKEVIQVISLISA